MTSRPRTSSVCSYGAKYSRLPANAGLRPCRWPSPRDIPLPRATTRDHRPVRSTPAARRVSERHRTCFRTGSDPEGLTPVSRVSRTEHTHYWAFGRHASLRPRGGSASDSCQENQKEPRKTLNRQTRRPAGLTQGNPWFPCETPPSRSRTEHTHYWACGRHAGLRPRRASASDSCQQNQKRTPQKH